MAFSQGGVEDEEGIYGMGNVGPAEKRSRVVRARATHALSALHVNVALFCFALRPTHLPPARLACTH